MRSCRVADGIEDIVMVQRERPVFDYPFAEGPETASGRSIEVTPGVHWLRMPLGGPLGFINVWAIREADGWAIVDTGLSDAPTMDAWRKSFAGPLKGAVSRVFVTHMHPDHIGMAGWLTRKFDARLWTSRQEFLMSRNLVADTGREAPQDGLRFYRSAGWDSEQIETYRTRFGGFGRAVYALPDSFRRVVDGETFTIGDHVWEVVVGAGHSPEHVCLYCPDLKLMISGDQVLPLISSNVSVFPTEPTGDPLTDWLRSLAAIKGRVPDEVLVLPAHNSPFHGLHARIDYLIEGHELALVRLADLIATPRRAVDVFPALFRREIDEYVIGLATGESLAHLNCLLARGLAVKTTDAQGVDWYQAL